MTKRQFLELATKYTVGGLTAVALLGQLSPNYALAQQVEFTDPDIIATYITYPSPNGHGEVRGYLVRPAKSTGPLPAVVVVHENRGLNPYIEDVARRVAKAGFIALAPDGLSSVGGYPGNDDKGRELQAQVDPTKLMNDFFAAIEFLTPMKAPPARSASPAFAMVAGWRMRQRSPTPNWPLPCPFMADNRSRKMSPASKPPVTALRRVRYQY